MKLDENTTKLGLVPKAISEAITKSGKSQSAVANELGFDRSCISEVLTGKESLSVKKTGALLQHLGVRFSFAHVRKIPALKKRPRASRIDGGMLRDALDIAVEKSGISVMQLAIGIGTQPQAVSCFLRTGANLSLRKVSAALEYLGVEYEID